MYYIPLNRMLEESFSLVGGRERFVSVEHRGDSSCFMKALHLEEKAKEKIDFSISSLECYVLNYQTEILKANVKQRLKLRSKFIVRHKFQDKTNYLPTHRV